MPPLPDWPWVGNHLPGLGGEPSTLYKYRVRLQGQLNIRSGVFPFKIGSLAGCCWIRAELQRNCRRYTVVLIANFCVSTMMMHTQSYIAHGQPLRNTMVWSVLRSAGGAGLLPSDYGPPFGSSALQINCTPLARIAGRMLLFGSRAAPDKVCA